MKAELNQTLIKGNNNEIKVFTSNLEYEAWDQLKLIANEKAYSKSKIRVMPDVHAGKGCTVGTTMTIHDKVAPNLVGVDIGCGMLTVNLGKIDLNLQELDSVIHKNIPHGFGAHNNIKKHFNFNNLKCENKINLQRAAYSLGSLGGGNHFIEIDKDNEGQLFLVIHSGSRNLGVQVCKHYQDLAWSSINEMKTIKKILIEKLKSEGRESEIQSELKKIKKVDISKDLAYVEGHAFDDYIHDMEITQNYAKLNRETMVEIIMDKMKLKPLNLFHTVHNYIDTKNMILRKGAVSAEKDETLLIPINMRDGSLICVGKGNEDWNYSAPHGAGRIMSRSKAKKNLALDEFKEQMVDIYSSSVNKSTLDEAPDAYKSIDEIIQNINGTVEITKKIKPIYNFKSH